MTLDTHVLDGKLTSVTAVASPTPPTARRGLLRHRDFLKLWSGETISVFGSQITLLALPWIAATILHVSPFEFGLLGTIEFLPFIMLSLPAGVWVDRLRRRPILIAGDVGRAVSLASIPIAFYFDGLTIWQLYVVGFINGCLTVFFDVSYQSYLPSIVDRDQLVEGNSKLEITRSASQILGPGMAGPLIDLVKAPFAILLDALSFLVSAVMVLWIRRPEPPPEVHDATTGPRPSMRQEIGAGLRYVTGHRWLRSIAATTGTSNLFSNVSGAILLLWLVNDHDFSASQLGFAFSLGSFGVLGAALTASRISRWLGVGRTLVVSSIGFGIAGLPLILAPADLLFPAVAGSVFLGGYFGVVWNINQISLRQAITPTRMQGKMNATMRFIVWGTIPLGMIAGGFLGGVIGLFPTVAVGAIGSLFAFLPVALSPVRQLRDMPEPLADEAEASATAAAGA